MTNTRNFYMNAYIDTFATEIVDDDMITTPRRELTENSVYIKMPCDICDIKHAIEKLSTATNKKLCDGFDINIVKYETNIPNVCFTDIHNCISECSCDITLEQLNNTIQELNNMSDDDYTNLIDYAKNHANDIYTYNDVLYAYQQLYNT